MLSGNKVVSKREEEKQRQKHEFRLKSMKSIIDSSTPVSLINRISNAKKIQLMEGNTYLEKCTEIERENRILYEKMLRIRNQTPTLRSSSTKKSLNITYRKQKLLEIEQANAELSERIKRRESAYRVDKFNIDRKETERILTAICEFPLISNAKRRESTTSLTSRKTPKRSDKISENLVYRQGKILNNKSYLLEIYKKKDAYKIAAFDLESPDRLELRLPSDICKFLITEAKDFKKLVDLIEIHHGVLILKNSRPVSAIT